MDISDQKRISILLGFFVLLVALFTWRLFQKQVTEHEGYKAQAAGQYIIKKDLPAVRGKIISADKFPLATNERLYQLMIVPRYIANKDKMAVAEKIAPFTEKTADEIYSLINNDKYYLPPLRTRMTEKEGDEIAALKLKGVLVTPESVRSYPENQLAAQLLGFVDASGNGRYGLEGFYNNELKGIGGEIFGERDTKGRLFDIGDSIGAQNGSDFVLTIDRQVQFKAEEILTQAVEKYGADSGSLIIVEPSTGRILSMANAPTFDPNLYNKVPSSEQNVFNNPAINNAYEPGSVFKPLIMAAAIDQGKVQPDTKNTFGASVKVDSFTIKTSTEEAYGEETMTQVLENSDNVAMVWISELLGKDTMYKYIKDFGFGRKSGIELDTESAGDVAEAKKWSNSQRATVSFGQGMTATPLQVLMATAAIANHGKLMQPYLVDKIISPTGKEEQRSPKEITQVVRDDTAKKVSEMMVSVVVNGHGKKAGVRGYNVAGKTGTAQIPKPGGGYYSDRHIGSFVGFAPATDPKFAMIVRLDNPKAVEWAESSAAPAFGEMAKWLLEYLSVPPDAS